MVKLDGYELILGSSVDPQFGPVLLFGAGGQLVEVFKDRALALPPLNTTLARRMMEQTKIYTALQGRARPQAGGSRRRWSSCWCASASWWSSSAGSRRSTSTRCWPRRERLVALDARVVLHDPKMSEAGIPRRPSGPIRRSMCRRGR